MKPEDLEVGRLAAVSVSGVRSLVFEGRSGTRLVLEESIIVGAQKVAAGVNYAVDVIYGPTISEVGAVCIVGPRGRMKTIFAAIGHPI